MPVKRILAVSLTSQLQQDKLKAQNQKTMPMRGLFASAIGEDLLTGGRALRRAFADAPSLTARRGDIVIGRGDSSPAVLYLQRGLVFSSRTLSDGRRAIVDIFLPNDVIGIEHVVLGRASAEIAAAAIVGYRSLNANILRRHVESNPQMTLRVLALTAEHKARRDRHALALARLDASERIADFIIGIYDRLRLAGLIARPTFNLPLTQDQIADHLGITTVHVSRILKRLRDERLLLVDRGVVIIADVDALRRAGGELTPPQIDD